MFFNDCFDATVLPANGSVLVSARGDIDINTAGAFAAALSEASGWSQRIFVDLQDVEFIGVAGLRALELVLRDMKRRFGTGDIIVLAAPTTLWLMAGVVGLPVGLTLSATLANRFSRVSLVDRSSRDSRRRRV